MQYDKVIKIATAPVRTAKVWPLKEVNWSTFIGELRTPLIGTETLEQYTLLDKKAQDQLKDVGGFVGGVFRNNNRRGINLIARSILTLDLDNVPSGETQTVIDRVESLGYGYVTHSTRKHHSGAPRLRVVMALDRECTPDEYEPLSRKIGELIGIEYCDPTTFQPNRLMFYPSCCTDSEYIYQWKDAPFVPVDGTLALYNDWRDTSSWPHSSSAPLPTPRRGRLQADPRMKTCIVGAFCRTYDVREAISNFLSDVYVEGENGRYTHVGSRTDSGGEVYDDGLFLYSYHGTDPAGGTNRNAFDLVRIHKFGHLDEGAESGFTGDNFRSKSNTAMREFAETLPEVMEEWRGYNLAQKRPDFEGSDWVKKLMFDGKGNLKKCIDNACLVIANDPHLKGKFYYDSFSNRVKIVKDLPWTKGGRSWNDKDDKLMYRHFERLGFYHKQSIDSGLACHYGENPINELQNYIEGLEWDGVERAEKIFIDYLGAEDSLYNKVATKMWLVGAISRALEPGCQFDLMLITTGGAGLGKSKFLRGLSKGWIAENFVTFKGKEAQENIQGKWIIDVGELGAFGTASREAIKSFLTQESDFFRVSYGRHSEDFPRQCVFTGTTNSVKFLSDPTGDRRFIPIKIGEQEPTKHFRKVDLEADQIWAEALSWYQEGAEAFYDAKSEYYALITAHQEMHREEGLYEAEVLDFIDKKVLPNWNSMTKDQRNKHWADYSPDNPELVERDTICATEVWHELLFGELLKKDAKTIKHINEVIRRTKKWKDHLLRVDYIGVTRGFIKIAP